MCIIFIVTQMLEKYFFALSPSGVRCPRQHKHTKQALHTVTYINSVTWHRTGVDYDMLVVGAPISMSN